MATTVQQAVLRLPPGYLAADQQATYSVGAFRYGWSESTLPYADQPPCCNLQSDVSAPTRGRPREVGVAPIVQAWPSGDADNNGLRLWDRALEMFSGDAYRATFFCGRDDHDARSQRPQPQVKAL